MVGEEEWKAHAERVGRVTLAWNGAVFQLLRVFSHLTGIGSPLAETIFFSHPSDRAQRGMIRKVAAAVNLADADRLGLVALLDRLDKLATRRNLAAHTIFGLSMFDPTSGAWAPTVVPALERAHNPRLEADFARQFRGAESDLTKISRDLESWLVHTPFPERLWAGPPFLGPVPG